MSQKDNIKKNIKKVNDKSASDISLTPSSLNPDNLSDSTITNDKISDKNKSDSSSNTIPKIIDMDYLPIVVDISTVTNESFYTVEPNIELSVGIDYPKFTYGFHHFIHSNKNKMEIVEQFKNKKKVYLVVNKFERYIDNYEQSIGNISVNFFGLSPIIKNGPPNILSRGFYKLWELFFMFDLIPINETKFVSAHLAEGPGSFIQATMFFRDKFCKNANTKNDKYHAITLHPEDENVHVPELEKTFIEYYDAEKPKRFFLHKTYSKQVAGGMTNKDNGDLCDPKTIVLFGGQIEENGGKAHFITADGGLNWKNENTQEQEAFRLLFAQIMAAVKIQSKGGNFVCKFYETFSETSVKLIYLLTQLYDKIYLVKPLTSRPSNSEKYAVCLGFKFTDKNTETDKQYVSIYKNISNIHDILHKNKTLNISKLWDSLQVPESFKINIIHTNKTIANKQIKSINNITEFINSQNYYGDNYQLCRQMQIDASKYWNKVFMPQSENFDTNIEYARNSTLKIIEKTKKLLENIKYH